MQLLRALTFAPAFLALVGVPALIHAQQDAYNCVKVVWKSAYNADFVYDTCSRRH
jgi:hypothetical protein